MMNAFALSKMVLNTEITAVAKHKIKIAFLWGRKILINNNIFFEPFTHYYVHIL